MESVFIKMQNVNAITHSYTAQYSITPSGKLLPRVFLRMQGTFNKYGPLVASKVKQSEEEYEHVIVTCSKSGKFTKYLYKEYLESSLKLSVQNHLLLILDSWGHTDGV